MGPYTFLFVLIDSMVSFWVFIGLLRPYGPYNCFCVLMDSNGSLWLPIVPYSSLRILMGPYRSF